MPLPVLSETYTANNSLEMQCRMNDKDVIDDLYHNYTEGFAKTPYGYAGDFWLDMCNRVYQDTANRMICGEAAKRLLHGVYQSHEFFDALRRWEEKHPSFAGDYSLSGYHDPYTWIYADIHQ